MDRPTHTFDNGVVVYADQLLQAQCQRYAASNVHEAEEEEIFLRLLAEIPQGGVFINIGSAIGYYSLLARRQRPDVRICCFEPLPSHREAFGENIKLNHLDAASFTVFPQAIAAKRGQAIFQNDSYSSHLIKSKSSLAHILKRLFAPPPQDTFRVQTIPLAKVFELTGHTTLDLVQIDIQGAEKEVLESFFQKPHPKLRVTNFLIGTHGAHIHQACAALLASHGYTLVDNIPTPLHQPDGILSASLR